MRRYLFNNMNINTFISDLTEAVQPSHTLSSDFLQLFQPLPSQQIHYLVHIDQRRSFCLNERNIYLKNTMENLIAKSLKNISALSVSASIHITEINNGIPYGTIAILNNRELAKEIREKQQKGKSLYFKYKDGKINKESLNSYNFIRGAFGETGDAMFFQGTADVITDYREELYSGKGELQSITYTAENQRSLSATLRQLKARREKTLHSNLYAEYRKELQEAVLIASLKENCFMPGLAEQERLNHLKQILEQEELVPISWTTARKAADYGFSRYTIHHSSEIHYARPDEDKRNALYFMKESWLPLMDFMESGEKLPFTKSQLEEIVRNARKIYHSTVDSKKPCMAAVAIKITALIEAAERENVFCFQTDHDSKSSPASSTLSFLTATEHSVVEYCCEGMDNATIVAERIPDFLNDLKAEIPPR